MSEAGPNDAKERLAEEAQDERIFEPFDSDKDPYTRLLEDQINRLANYLMIKELAPITNESACEAAIRVIKSLLTELEEIK